MHEKIYMDKDSLMPKKSKDLFQGDDFSCYFPLRRPLYGPLVAKVTKN
jgi:hypothetical protein